MESEGNIQWLTEFPNLINLLTLVLRKRKNERPAFGPAELAHLCMNTCMHLFVCVCVSVQVCVRICMCAVLISDLCMHLFVLECSNGAGMHNVLKQVTATSLLAGISSAGHTRIHTHIV